ncbi:MAG: hypothetical protein ACD_73C00531G0001, partial [uncultured bacterium]
GSQASGVFVNDLAVSDTNGDGINELLTGSPQYPIGGKGHMFKPLEFKNQLAKDFTAEQAGQVIQSATASHLGNTVVGKGDFNGDKIQDVLINDGTAENGKGVTYLLLGGK